MPYYAAIFSSTLSSDIAGYEAAAEEMLQLAAAMPGFLGVESVRGVDGKGLTVSYWESLEAISGWKEHPRHQEAKSRGKSEWYLSYRLRIARIEGTYER